MMPKEIAVYLGENGETASLNEKGKIVVYRKNLGEWKVTREKDLGLGQKLGLKELRQKMDELIEFLAECKIIVGASVVGVPYFALEKADFSVWEFEGRPAEFLDYILDKEEEAQMQKENQQETNIIPFPVETANGCYKISLKEIQQNNSGITSKQVLMPFLRKGKFYSLEVLCNHVPPWLEAELMSSNLTGFTEKISHNEIKITIAKKTCNQ